MEINELNTAERHQIGAEMQVKSENGEKLDCFITLVGVDSKTWRAIVKKNRRKIITGEEVDNAESLAEATLGWRGFTKDGVEYEFSKERVKALYDSAPYIQNQVDEFIANRENFTKA